MSFPYHAIFAVIAAGFFLFRFWCQPKAYRLLLAVWAPATMMGYLVDETWWSYLSLGVQIAFLAAYLVLKYLDKRREREEKSLHGGASFRQWQSAPPWRFSLFMQGNTWIPGGRMKADSISACAGRSRQKLWEGSATW